MYYICGLIIRSFSVLWADLCLYLNSNLIYVIRLILDNLIYLVFTNSNDVYLDFSFLFSTPAMRHFFRKVT